MCQITQGLLDETLRGESLELKLSAAAAQRRPRTVRPRRPRTPEIADSAQLGAEQVCMFKALGARDLESEFVFCLKVSSELAFAAMMGSVDCPTEVTMLMCRSLQALSRSVCSAFVVQGV